MVSSRQHCTLIKQEVTSSVMDYQRTHYIKLRSDGRTLVFGMVSRLQTELPLCESLPLMCTLSIPYLTL